MLRIDHHSLSWATREGLMAFIDTLAEQYNQEQLVKSSYAAILSAMMRGRKPLLDEPWYSTFRAQL